MYYLSYRRKTFLVVSLVGFQDRSDSSLLNHQQNVALLYQKNFTVVALNEATGACYIKLFYKCSKLVRLSIKVATTLA